MRVETCRRVAAAAVAVILVHAAASARGGRRTITGIVKDAAPTTVTGAQTAASRLASSAPGERLIDAVGRSDTDRVRLDLRGEADHRLECAQIESAGFTLGAAEVGVVSSARPVGTIPLGGRPRF